MDPSRRVVTAMPLQELFDERGPVEASRVGPLDADGVRAHLRSDEARFTVAQMGEPLRWLAGGDETFEFWRAEARPRLWDPSVEHLRLEELPDERAWSASEWRRSDGSAVVLFEEHH